MLSLKGAWEIIPSDTCTLSLNSELALQGRGVHTSTRKTMRAQSINFTFYIKNSFKFCIQFYKTTIISTQKKWMFETTGNQGKVSCTLKTILFPLSTIALGMDSSLSWQITDTFWYWEKKKLYDYLFLFY